MARARAQGRGIRDASFGGMGVRALGVLVVVVMSCARQDAILPLNGADRLTAERVSSPPPEREVASSTTITSAPLAALPARIDVDNVEGIPEEQVRSILVPYAPALRRCGSGRDGKLTFEVTSREGALHVTPVLGASLDPLAKECSLDALSIVPLSPSGTNVGFPDVPPSGFTALITLSW